MADPKTVSQLDYFPGSLSDLTSVMDFLCSPESDASPLVKDILYRVNGGQFLGAIMQVAGNYLGPHFGSGAPVDQTSPGPYYFDQDNGYKMYVGVYTGSGYDFHAVTM